MHKSSQCYFVPAKLVIIFVALLILTSLSGCSGKSERIFQSIQKELDTSEHPSFEDAAKQVLESRGNLRNHRDRFRERCAGTFSRFSINNNFDQFDDLLDLATAVLVSYSCRSDPKELIQKDRLGLGTLEVLATASSESMEAVESAGILLESHRIQLDLIGENSGHELEYLLSEEVTESAKLIDQVRAQVRSDLNFAKDKHRKLLNAEESLDLSQIEMYCENLLRSRSDLYVISLEIEKILEALV